MTVRVRQEVVLEPCLVGRALGRVKHAHHSLEAENRTMNHRNAELHARIVQHIARGEVVGAIDDDVVTRDDVDNVLR